MQVLRSLLISKVLILDSVRTEYLLCPPTLRREVVTLAEGEELYAISGRAGEIVRRRAAPLRRYLPRIP